MTDPLPLAPHVLILLKLESVAKTVDYQGLCGIADAVTVRHSRNRKPVRSERPALTLIFVSDDEQQSENQHNMGETVREMVVDLQADIELDTEDSDRDPTGLGILSAFLAAAVQAFRHPDTYIFLDGMVDWVGVGALDPDERSQPDEGRLVRAISVLYRVRSDDPNILLDAGANG